MEQIQFPFADVADATEQQCSEPMDTVIEECPFECLHKQLDSVRNDIGTLRNQIRNLSTLVRLSELRQANDMAELRFMLRSLLFV